MADVSLDDLIKKDKEKRQPHRGDNRGFRRGGKPRQFARRHRDDDRRDDRRDGRRRGRGRFNDRPRRDYDDDDREERVDRRREERQPVGPSAEGRKLRVMGLHPDVTNSYLFKLFSYHGTLEKCLIDLDYFGRSRTTGIVIYNSADSARNAIQNLNRSKILESVITVDYWNRDRDSKRFKAINKGRSFRN